MIGPIREFPLDSASTEVLNRALDGSDLDGMAVDVENHLAVATLNVFSILPEEWSIHVEYPLCLVMYPVAGLRVSYMVDGEARLVSAADLDGVIKSFPYRTIEDWDIIDPPAGASLFLEREPISLDFEFGGTGDHAAEFWQDGGPRNDINIRVEFARLFVLDRQTNSVMPETISRWKGCLEATMRVVTPEGKGWVRSIPEDSQVMNMMEILRLVKSYT